MTMRVPQLADMHGANTTKVSRYGWTLTNAPPRLLMIQKLLDACIYIEMRMPDGESLSDARWRSRLLQVGEAQLMDGIKRSAAYYARGGARVFACGVRNEVNRRLQYRLPVVLEEGGESQ